MWGLFLFVVLGVASAVRTVWDAEARVGVAATTKGESSSSLPASCGLAVVGAGWGGAYFAWRAAVESDLFDPSSVCVFEANGRVGGRIYSIHDLPSLRGLALDDGLPTDLIQKGLSLPSRCYDANCAPKCPGRAPEGNHTCYVITDAYGNNAGYATGIERMLDDLIARGARVFFGARLVAVDTRRTDNASSALLTLSLGGATTEVVEAGTLLLNLPRNAIAKLGGSWLDTAPREVVEAVLEDVTYIALTKVYASYEDAWWISKLGLVEGDFATEATAPVVVPVAGRYHDGPLKCVVGRDAEGRPIYADEKVPFGNCAGALEVYYAATVPFWAALADTKGDDEPLSVYSDDDEDGGELASSREKEEVLDAVHAALMAYHATALAARGLKAADIPRPRLVTVANWIATDAIAPGCGKFTAGAQAMKLARKPLPDAPIYLANSDYGPQSCWATGSLELAEKNLQDLGLSKPAWLGDAWYHDKVASLP